MYAVKVQSIIEYQELTAMQSKWNILGKRLARAAHADCRAMKLTIEEHVILKMDRVQCSLLTGCSPMHCRYNCKHANAIVYTYGDLTSSNDSYR